jgi:hypothetical protein
LSTPTLGPANGQFLRAASLVLSAGGSGSALEISQPLRFRFEVRAADVETPNTATITVYNLKQETANSIIKEYDSVTLNAGYVYGNQGIIFQGKIKQFRTGRERNVDSYLQIMAADGDESYNFGVVNQSFKAGSDYGDQLDALSKAMGTTIDPNAQSFVSTGGVLPRGKVLFGMARTYMHGIAKNTSSRWSIQNGKLTLIPNTGYLPGQAVVINSASGMIGTPEQTDAGITLRCYLNPLIQIGRAVQINNRDINQTIVKEQGGVGGYTAQYYPATVTNDGIYRVIVAEHVGDTRGNDWYSELTCLAIDRTSPANTSVKAHG